VQPDELKGHRCRKEENAMVKSLKSRYRKSRCCKVKDLPGGDLIDIGVHTFFRPRRVAIYVLRTTRLLADYDTVYLHLKKTNTY
jgi:hypothetical protein